MSTDEPVTRRSLWESATFAPLHQRIYRAIWIASMVSNFGSLIQAVGAAWLMTSLAPGATMVALVQTSTALSVMLLSLPAGAIADIWDRRRLMMLAQITMLIVSIVLAVLTLLGRMTPWTLLSLTFLLGCGMAIYGPAWQSSVGEQVPRDQIPAAVALNSLGYNFARTLGPALGGAIVAALGATAAFLVNAASYVALIVVLAGWKRHQPTPALPPESMTVAIKAGLRYARLAPSIRAVLLRSLAFSAVGSAVWALMPVIARDLVAGGALTYGILFGGFGGGAVLGALASTPLRQRLRNEVLVRTATLGFGVAVLVAGLSHWTLLTLLALIGAGAAWVIVLATFTTLIQTAAPRWVVGRAMAIYQMAVFGGMALGSWWWGLLAEQISARGSLLGSALGLGAAALIGLRVAVPESENANLDPSSSGASPQPRVELDPESGPVVMTIEYRIAAVDREVFLSAMQELRRIRRRDGARRWTLLQDITEPERWLERFHNPSWLEYLRQHQRFTVDDRQAQLRVLALHRSAEAPVIRHYVVRVPSTGVGEIGVLDPNLPGTPAPLASRRE
ncbi:MAG: MFS transporter [Gammaproteobacteria bacterium]|nr:MFS transporter [Gammaproteobacteria bacterium]